MNDKDPRRRATVADEGTQLGTSTRLLTLLFTIPVLTFIALARAVRASIRTAASVGRFLWTILVGGGHAFQRLGHGIAAVARNVGQASQQLGRATSAMLRLLGHGLTATLDLLGSAIRFGSGAIAQPVGHFLRVGLGGGGQALRRLWQASWTGLRALGHGARVASKAIGHLIAAVARPGGHFLRQLFSAAGRAIRLLGRGVQALRHVLAYAGGTTLHALGHAMSTAIHSLLRALAVLVRTAAPMLRALLAGFWRALSAPFRFLRHVLFSTLALGARALAAVGRPVLRLGAAVARAFAGAVWHAARTLGFGGEPLNEGPLLEAMISALFLLPLLPFLLVVRIFRTVMAVAWPPTRALAHRAAAAALLLGRGIGASLRRLGHGGGALLHVLGQAF